MNVGLHSPFAGFINVIGSNIYTQTKYERNETEQQQLKGNKPAI